MSHTSSLMLWEWTTTNVVSPRVGAAEDTDAEAKGGEVGAGELLQASAALLSDAVPQQPAASTSLYPPVSVAAARKDCSTFDSPYNWVNAASISLNCCACEA